MISYKKRGGRGTCLASKCTGTMKKGESKRGRHRYHQRGGGRKTGSKKKTMFHQQRAVKGGVVLTQSVSVLSKNRQEPIQNQKKQKQGTERMQSTR